MSKTGIFSNVHTEVGATGADVAADCVTGIVGADRAQMLELVAKA